MKTTKLFGLIVCGLVLLGMSSNANAAVELITNGGFETGDLTGWTLVDGGSGSVEVTAAFAPTNGIYATAGPSSGTFYAVSSQGGPGTHAILQTINVAPGPATLSFDWFVQTFRPI